MLTIVINRNKCLGSYLRKLQIDKKARYRYVILGERVDSTINLLEQKGFQEIVPTKYDPLYRNRFLREYIDLIGIMGKEYNSTK